MKTLLMIGLVSAAVCAALPPLDWRSYVSILLVAVNAFWLGTEAERGT